MSTKLVNCIKRKMQENNLTIASLERLANLKENAISNIIKGRSKNPTISTLSAIAKALNCSVDTLIGHQYKQYNETIPWNHITFYGITKIINNTILEKNLSSLTTIKIIDIIEETYFTSMISNNQHIDYTFIQWIVDNIQNNTIKINQHQKKSDQYKNIPWNAHLFSDIIQTTNNIIQKKSISLSASKVIYIIKEMYYYTMMRNNNSNIDCNIIEWFIEKIYNNEIQNI